jgi:hypothetical protein
MVVSFKGFEFANRHFERHRQGRNMQTASLASFSQKGTSGYTSLLCSISH